VGTVFIVHGDGVQFLSPCRPLVQSSSLFHESGLDNPLQRYCIQNFLKWRPTYILDLIEMEISVKRQ